MSLFLKYGYPHKPLQESDIRKLLREIGYDYVIEDLGDNIYIIRDEGILMVNSRLSGPMKRFMLIKEIFKIMHNNIENLEFLSNLIAITSVVKMPYLAREAFSSTNGKQSQIDLPRFLYPIIQCLKTAFIQQQTGEYHNQKSLIY